MPGWILPTLIGSVFASCLTCLLFLLKNRRTLLAYHVQHDPIAISTIDSTHGQIKVTLGGLQVNNLYLSSIYLVNRGMRDIEDMEVKVFCSNKDMRILSEQTTIESTVEVLNHTTEYEEFKSQLAKVSNEVKRLRQAGDCQGATELEESQDPIWHMWYTQRWYAVPVLSRNQTIKFTYMTNVESDTNPEIYISIQKAGVRLQNRQPHQPVGHLFGVPLVEAALAGIAIGLLIWWLIISSLSTLWLAALLCFIAGLFSNLPGATAVKLSRWAREKLIG